MAETVALTLSRLQAFIQESYPSADIAPGSVLDSLLLKASASLQNLPYNQVAQLSLSANVSAALASTTDTYNTIIDGLASNFLVTRGAGTKSTGYVKVYVTSSQNYFLGSGTNFTQPSLNLTYSTTQAYTISPTPTVEQTQLSKEADGSYSFVIQVTADSVGSQYQVSNNTVFDLTNAATLSGFIKASSIATFSSATAQETDKALIARFTNGITNGSLVNKKSILSTLSSQFTSLSAVSVIGATDPEMSRCKSNAFNTLGMADVYVRTSGLPLTQDIVVTATKNSDLISWSFTLDSSVYGGIYEVSAIRPSSTVIGTYPIISQVPGISVPTTGNVNVFNASTGNSINQARFTSYQKLNITYSNPTTEPAGTTASVVVTILYLPNIKDIQQVFLNDTTRIACADYLVKAVLPCFVNFNITLVKATTTTVVDTASLKQDIFKYVNSIPFGENLYISEIVKLCHSYPIKQVTLPVTLTGTILANDGSTVTITGNNELQIPTNLPLGISPNTTMFFIDYFTDSSGVIADNIGITLL